MATYQTASGRREWRPSANLPPLTMLDIATILVAVIGTAVLILLAATTAAGDEGGFSAVSSGRVLIALGATLVNLAHVVGIIFFESVNYHGVFQRFFAKLSLYGTPIALLVSVALGWVF
jgi:hypothetical protein